MRLIDADLLMENLGFDDTEEEREENVGQIITWEDVDRMPTAFDVEEVIEQLKALPRGSTWNHNSDNINRDKAIEIVKRGGRDEK